MVMLPGFATPAATQAHATATVGDTDPGHYRPDAQQLSLSSLGMGTYLGETTTSVDGHVADAVRASVLSGAVNILDTAINYRAQRAERVVGEMLQQLITEEGVDRQALFVATKNGYLAPDADDPRPVPQYFKETLIDTGILPPEQVVQGCHSLHVPFLQHQLAASRRNLGLDTLDLLYLHNVAESQLPEIKPNKLMDRLAAAFDFLESARAQGHIRFYGLATWDCFRVPVGDAGYLSLLEVVKLAESVGGSGHGLRYVQLPFNLAMPEAAVEAFQPDSPGSSRLYPVLRVAETLGLGVMTSVPLCQGQLLGGEGLPTFPGLDHPAQQCLQAVRCTPGIIAPLIGHKTPAHVQQNLLVARQPIYKVEGKACH
jgi:aryl-alcohol dehydrogenase-like predicted oxidoreductase